MKNYKLFHLFSNKISCFKSCKSLWRNKKFSVPKKNVSFNNIKLMGLLGMSVIVVSAAFMKDGFDGENENQENNTKVVVVTGATGFVAGHVIEELLREGYNVRGTVRNPNNKAGFQHLIDISKDVCGDKGEERLTFFKADLVEEGSFDEVTKGAYAVMHVASNVTLKVKDVESELVKPAVDGTLNVMRSCAKNDVKVVVLTSSVAVIENGIPEGPKDKWVPYDETSNNTKCSPKWKAYSYSKVKALEAANKYHEELKEKGETFRMITIHPSAIYGPQQNSNVTSSNQIVQVLISGEFPLYPQLWWPSCDVRDVARAHVLTLKNEKATGRYIINNCHAWMREYAELMREKYPEAPVPKYGMPNLLFKIASFFDSRIDEATVKEQTLEGNKLDGSKICKDLGFEYKYEWKESIIDTVDSFVKHNCGEKKKKWIEKYKKNQEKK